MYLIAHQTAASLSSGHQTRQLHLLLSVLSVIMRLLVLL
jgi:hypothetical protein